MSKITPDEELVNKRFTDVYKKLKAQKKTKGKGDLMVSLEQNREYYSRIERFDMPVPDTAVKLLSQKYQISEEWLLNGIGSMFYNPVKEFASRSDKLIESQSVPLYAFEASAGLVKLFSNSENVLDYIKIPNLPKCDGAVHISGDSMYPLLKSGDIVMYKQIQDIEHGLIWGEMYLLSITLDDDFLTLVKYIQKSDKGPDYVKLVSQNQHHAPLDVPIRNIRALGYIKASIRINSMA